MDYNLIIKKVEAHVIELFQKTPHPKLIYHNVHHTQKVVERTKEIAAHYNLIESDMLVLLVAAWFHDTGYLFDEAAMHEEKSAHLMNEFTKDLIADPDIL
ncbi:MAG TPA: HD domain-containing protein, partial [Segetibacter sp.]|nr:HD domain-containing protein [Segetibacter sp.]